MERPVKNPDRVPRFSLEDNPAGRAIPPRHVIDAFSARETIIMPTAKKTGIYKDQDGNQFLITEGAAVPEGVEYSHADDTGTLEASGPVAEDLDPQVRMLNAAPENRAEGPAENKGKKS